MSGIVVMITLQKELLLCQEAARVRVAVENLLRNELLATLPFGIETVQVFGITPSIHGSKWRGLSVRD